VQKFVFIDEGSTHVDARTNAHEIASQFSPFSKRFAKLSVDFATIGHTIKDVHSEVKRQATTFFYKPEKTQVQLSSLIPPMNWRSRPKTSTTPMICHHSNLIFRLLFGGFRNLMRM